MHYSVSFFFCLIWSERTSINILMANQKVVAIGTAAKQACNWAMFGSGENVIGFRIMDIKMKTPKLNKTPNAI